MNKERPIAEEEALRLLKDKGYIVKRPATYRKRTFEVDEEIYKTFRYLQESLGLKVKEAFNLAMEDWVVKHSDRVKK